MFFFSLGQDGKLFLWLVFDEAGSRLVFFCLRRALSVFSFYFLLKKQVPMVTPQDWPKGTRWDGMPYHVTLGHPGWRVTSEQVEARSFFSFWSSSRFFTLTATFN